MVCGIGNSSPCFMDGFNNVKTSTDCLTEADKFIYPEPAVVRGWVHHLHLPNRLMQAKKVFSGENGKTQVCPIGGCWHGRSCGWPHWNEDVFCHPLGLCIWSALVSFKPGQLWAANHEVTVWTGMLQGLCWLLRLVVVLHIRVLFLYVVWSFRLNIQALTTGNYLFTDSLQGPNKILFAISYCKVALIFHVEVL